MSNQPYIVHEVNTPKTNNSERLAGMIPMTEIFTLLETYPSKGATSSEILESLQTFIATRYPNLKLNPTENEMLSKLVNLKSSNRLSCPSSNGSFEVQEYRKSLVPLDNYGVVSANIDNGIMNISIDIESLYMIVMVIGIIIMVFWALQLLFGNGFNMSYLTYR